MREVLDTLARQMAERDAERGKRIQALRLARGFRSAEAAAQAVHVSHRTFQNWEAGKTIDEGNIPMLAKVLQVSEDELRLKPLEVPDPVRSDSLRNQLDRIEEKLDEVLRRLSEPDATQGAPPMPSRRPKPPPALPNQRGKPAPRKRRAESG